MQICRCVRLIALPLILFSQFSSAAENELTSPVNSQELDVARIDPVGLSGTLHISSSPDVSEDFITHFLRGDGQRVIVVDSQAKLDTGAIFAQFQKEGAGSLTLLKRPATGLSAERLERLRHVDRLWIAVSKASGNDLADTCRHLLSNEKLVAISGVTARRLGSHWTDAKSIEAASIEAASADDAEANASESTNSVEIETGWNLVPGLAVIAKTDDVVQNADTLFSKQKSMAMVLSLPVHGEWSFKGRRVSTLHSPSGSQSQSSSLSTSSAELILPPSEQWRERRFELRRTPYDLVALRRASRRRSAENSIPLAEMPPIKVDHGTLMLVGGGSISSRLIERFVQHAGGNEASIIILPTAQPDPVSDQRQLSSRFKKAGARKVTVLKQRGYDAVASSGFIQEIDDASGIWFSGGRQWRFVDAYENTPAIDAMFRLLKRGGVVGGTSAGASIQGEYLARGNPLGNAQIMSEGYERGFGFLPGTAVDQHFTRRHRLPELRALVKARPRFLGIGLDEGTAIVVQGSTADVVGRSQVHFVWNSNDEPDDLATKVVKANSKFDLALRRVVTD